MSTMITVLVFLSYVIVCALIGGGAALIVPGLIRRLTTRREVCAECGSTAIVSAKIDEGLANNPGLA